MLQIETHRHLPSNTFLHPRRDRSSCDPSTAAALPLAREPVRPRGKGLSAAAIVGLRLGLSLRELDLQRRSRQEAVRVWRLPAASVGRQVGLSRQQISPVNEPHESCLL